MGQTFCLRVMFTGFMLDASKIIKFEDPGMKPISFEWSIFKPQKSGKQVSNQNEKEAFCLNLFSLVLFYWILVWKT